MTSPQDSAEWVAFHFNAVGSTNDEALELSHSHPGKIVRVSAATQTAARGSRRRTWISPRGGAWFSLAVPVDSPQRVTPVVVGQALLEVLSNYANGLTLKAPNDILHDGKKLAGVLCEQTLMPGQTRTTVVIGVGINANFPAAQLGPDLRTPPTTLRDLRGADVDLNALIEQSTLAIVNRLPARLA